MEHHEEFAQSEEAQKLSAKIRAAITKPWTIMEICGRHTHTILEYGLDKLIPSAIRLVHGPGCAICITPLEIINRASAIARAPDVIFCVFGELLRVPGSRSDLLDAKALGADVRVVYSPLDCVEIARANSDRKVVFFAVGTEKSLPANAQSLLSAVQNGVKNYFILSSQAHMPPICAAVLERHMGTVNAVLGPGDGCSVIGFKEYESVCKQFNVPVVVTGVEPIDVLEGLYRCVMQLESGKHTVENQYSTFASRFGNSEQLNLINKVFGLHDYRWRRLGAIKQSGYQLKPEYDAYNAWLAFAGNDEPVRESSVCISEEVMCGMKKPSQCPAFGKKCTLHHPVGATMVSSHGTCALYYKFRAAEIEKDTQEILQS